MGYSMEGSVLGPKQGRFEGVKGSSDGTNRKHLVHSQGNSTGVNTFLIIQSDLVRFQK